MRIDTGRLILTCHNLGKPLESVLSVAMDRSRQKAIKIMNTSTHYVLPLYTVRNRRGEAAAWLNGTVFVTANRCSADDCALAFRRYTDDNVFTGNITGAWGVVEHNEPVRISTHTRRVHAIRELNDRKESDRGIKCEIRKGATGFELWAIPQMRAFGSL